MRGKDMDCAGECGTACWGMKDVDRSCLADCWQGTVLIKRLNMHVPQPQQQLQSQRNAMHKAAMWPEQHWEACLRPGWRVSSTGSFSKAGRCCSVGRHCTTGNALGLCCLHLHDTLCTLHGVVRYSPLGRLPVIWLADTSRRERAAEPPMSDGREPTDRSTHTQPTVVWIFTQRQAIAEGHATCRTEPYAEPQQGTALMASSQANTCPPESGTP